MELNAGKVAQQQLQVPCAQHGINPLILLKSSLTAHVQSQGEGKHRRPWILSSHPWEFNLGEQCKRGNEKK